MPTRLARLLPPSEMDSRPGGGREHRQRDGRRSTRSGRRAFGARLARFAALRRAPPASRDASPRLPPSAISPRSTSAMSPAVANRSAGNLASAWRTTSSTSSGTVPRTIDERRDLVERVARDDRLRRRPRERRLSGDHLVQHAAQAVDVAPAVDSRIGHRLLGTHVRRRAERDAGARELGAAALGDRARDAEIGDERLAVLQQDVLRLDVAVNDALLVRVVERATRPDTRCCTASGTGAASRARDACGSSRPR